MNDLNNAVNELVDRLNKQKALELDALVAKFRKYPNGFEFYYPSTEGTPEKGWIFDAYIGRAETNKKQIWYKCKVPSWTLDEDEFMPLVESVIDRAVAKFGQEGLNGH